MNEQEPRRGEPLSAGGADEESARRHPRPQLTRPWTDLSGPWRFAHDDEDRGRDAGWWRGDEPFDREIVVPYPPESTCSGIADPGFHPVLWYQRGFRSTPTGDRRILLHSGAV
ncbi:MAG: glycoside hydrolase family 2, partial [Actinomycetes bacterium]